MGFLHTSSSRAARCCKHTEATGAICTAQPARATGQWRPFGSMAAVRPTSSLCATAAAAETSCLARTSGPTKTTTRVTQRMTYSFSRESGRLKAPNSFCRRSFRTGDTSARVKRGLPASCTQQAERTAAGAWARHVCKSAWPAPAKHMLPRCARADMRALAVQACTQQAHLGGQQALYAGGSIGVDHV